MSKRTFTFPDGSTAELDDAEYARAQRFVSMERDADDTDDPAQLSGWQMAGKFGADMLPPVGGALGTVAGFGAGNLPGAIGMGTLGTTGGVALRDIAYDAMGIPMDRSLGARATRLGLGAVEGALGAGMQAVPMKAAQQLPRLAAPTMKAAIGNAEPGVERLLLKYGIKPTEQGVAHAKKLMGAQMDLREQAIQQAEAAGRVFSWKGLAAALRARLVHEQRADLLSTVGEESIAKALKVLQEKVGRGPLVSQKPVPVRGSGGMVVTGPSGAPIRTRPVYAPAPGIKPTHMEEIKEAAAAEAQKLYKARTELGDKNPSTMELAYEAIAKQARRDLERIPGVRKANMTYKELRAAQKAARNAAKRSGGRPAAAAIIGGASAGVSTALAGHNPWLAAVGIPVGVATHAASSPAGFGNLAMLLNNPELMRAIGFGVGGVTRVPEAVLSGAGAFSPYDPSLSRPVGSKK